MSEFLDKHKTTIIISSVLTIIIIVLIVLYFTKSCTKEQCVQSGHDINQANCASVSADDGGPFLPITVDNCRNFSGAFWIDATNTIHIIGKGLTKPLLIINAIMIVVPYNGLVFIPQSNSDASQIVYSKNTTNYILYNNNSNPTNGVLCYDYRYFIHPLNGTNSNFLYYSAGGHFEYGFNAGANPIATLGNFIAIPTGNLNYIILDVGLDNFPGSGKVWTTDTNNKVSLSDLTTAVISNKLTQLSQSTLSTGSYEITIDSDPSVWKVINLQIASTSPSGLYFDAWKSGSGVATTSSSTSNPNSYMQTGSTLYNIYFPKFGDKFIPSY